MTWKRLEKENVLAVLDKLGSDENAIAFSKDFTEVVWDELGFYSSFQIYRLVNYATMPSFTMEYLSDGNVFIPLDGTANPIYAINAEAPIKLTEDNIISYLDFFFNHVRGGDGEIFLIHDAQTMPFLDTLDAKQQQSIIDCHKPLEVGVNTVNGEFTIRGTLYYGGCLIAATIHVSYDGRLSFKSRELLLRGIHFPHSTMNYYWMGGTS